MPCHSISVHGSHDHQIAKAKHPSIWSATGPFAGSSAGPFAGPFAGPSVGLNAGPSARPTACLSDQLEMVAQAVSGCKVSLDLVITPNQGGRLATSQMFPIIDTICNRPLPIQFFVSIPIYMYKSPGTCFENEFNHVLGNAICPCNTLTCQPADTKWIPPKPDRSIKLLTPVASDSGIYSYNPVLDDNQLCNDSISEELAIPNSVLLELQACDAARKLCDTSPHCLKIEFDLAPLLPFNAVFVGTSLPSFYNVLEISYLDCYQKIAGYLCDTKYFEIYFCIHGTDLYVRLGTIHNKGPTCHGVATDQIIVSYAVLRYLGASSQGTSCMIEDNHHGLVMGSPTPGSQTRLVILHTKLSEFPQEHETSKVKI